MSKEQEFLEFLVKHLVDEKEAVHIKLVEGEKTNVLEIKAANSDYGKIIGKKGRVVNAIRILLGVVGRQSGKRWVLDVPNKEGDAKPKNKPPSSSGSSGSSDSEGSADAPNDAE